MKESVDNINNLLQLRRSHELYQDRMRQGLMASIGIHDYRMIII